MSLETLKKKKNRSSEVGTLEQGIVKNCCFEVWTLKYSVLDETKCKTQVWDFQLKICV